jgi:hypothetical protein
MLINDKKSDEMATIQRTNETKFENAGSGTTFTAKGQTYTIMRYAEGEGPNFTQTIELAKRMKKELLTLKDAVAIVWNPKLNREFKDHMPDGSWAYIRDQKSDEGSIAICVLRHCGGMLVGEYNGRDQPSTAVVFKESSNASRAAELAPVAR